MITFLAGFIVGWLLCGYFFWWATKPYKQSMCANCDSSGPPTNGTPCRECGYRK